MRISKRLKSIAEFVDSNTSFIDVGCDHAYLSIYLVLNKNIKKAVASDNKEGPIINAKDNINKYNVSDKIDLRISDGLDNMDSDIDTVIISGMGGILINDILNKGDLTGVKNIVLSPNNDVEKVRRNVVSKGFYIDNEDFILDKGKYYNIISFKRGRVKYNNLQYKYGPVLIKNINLEYRDYLSGIRSKNLEIIKRLGIQNIKKIMTLKKEIREIDKII